MLIIESNVLRALKTATPDISGTRYFIDSHGDQYRLMLNGDVYVHWLQEDSDQCRAYSRKGALLGHLFLGNNGDIAKQALQCKTVRRCEN